MKKLHVKSYATMDRDLRPNSAWDQKVEGNRPQFLAPPLSFGQMRSSTSWSLHLLTPFLSYSVTPEESRKSLSILMLGL